MRIKDATDLPIHLYTHDRSGNGIYLDGDISVLDTLSFLYGLKLGEEIEVEIEKGKVLIIKLVSIGELQHDGTRVLYFELNGQYKKSCKRIVCTIFYLLRETSIII